jgi:hypothetical protein
MTSTQYSNTDSVLKLCVKDTYITPPTVAVCEKSTKSTLQPKKKEKRKRKSYKDTLQSIMSSTRTQTELDQSDIATIRKNTGGGKFAHGNLNRI